MKHFSHIKNVCLQRESDEIAFCVFMASIEFDFESDHEGESAVCQRLDSILEQMAPLVLA